MASRMTVMTTLFDGPPAIILWAGYTLDQLVRRSTAAEQHYFDWDGYLYARLALPRQTIQSVLHFPYSRHDRSNLGTADLTNDSAYDSIVFNMYLIRPIAFLSTDLQHAYKIKLIQRAHPTFLHLHLHF